jgi:hypothetical protein
MHTIILTDEELQALAFYMLRKLGMTGALASAVAKLEAAANASPVERAFAALKEGV